MTREDMGDPASPSGSQATPGAPDGSPPSVSIPIAKPFHELTDAEFEALCNAGTTWGRVAKLHPQPAWCDYPGALEGVAGCWSLIGRKVTGEEYCSDCECHTAQAIEARRAETQSGSVEDESAVGNADAPKEE